MADYRDRILECYIYFYHMDEWFILPQYPESITDAMQSTFSQQNALARTAPVFSYSNSGPRSLTVNLNLHRDMLNDLNKNNASIKTFNYENIQEQLNVKNPIGISQLTNARVPLEFTTDDYVDLLEIFPKEEELDITKADSDTNQNGVGRKPQEDGEIMNDNTAASIEGGQNVSDNKD